MMADPALLTATEQARLIRKGKLSPVELLEAAFARIGLLNDRLGAFITVMNEQATADAQRAETAVARKASLGLLHGVPIALKDNYETKGVRTTAGSRVFEDNVPDRDATVVERLREAGAVIIGKTHLNEFALGPVVLGEVRNPWGLDRSPGGSSCGSGVAVAASMCPIAMGHDTGGSTRIPAALCGVVGLKQTYGRVSRHGVLPLAWSLDHPGPLTRSVEDAALTLAAIADYDPKDPTSSRAKVSSYVRALRGGVKGLRLGIPRELFFDLVDPEVKQAVNDGVKLLQGLVASVREVSVPLVTEVEEFGQVIMRTEAVAIHEDAMAQSPEKYGQAFLAQLRARKFTLATDYIKAQRLRRVLRCQFLDALTKVDVIVTPTTAIPAPPLDQSSYAIQGKPVTPSYALGAFTRPFNQTGMPAITVPCGFTSDGLPIGLQVAGRPFGEGTVLRVAYTFERHTEWHKRRPQL